MFNKNLSALLGMLLAQCVLPVSYSPSDCAADWDDMNDQNYPQVVDRLRHCLTVSKELNDEKRNQFKSKMGEHFAATCKRFLEKTELSSKDLIKTIRSIMRETAPFLQEDEPACSSCTMTSTQPTEPADLQQFANNTSLGMNGTTVQDCVDKTCTVPFSDVRTTRASDHSDASVCGTSPAPKKAKDNTLLYEILILLGFLALILIQLILLLCLLCKCTMLRRLRECQCVFNNVCANDIQISKMCDEILDRNTQLYSVQHQAQVRSESEATPSTSAELAAGQLKRTADLSSLSSSDLGSDSEFEVLMRRRPLLETRKRTA